MLVRRSRSESRAKVLVEETGLQLGQTRGSSYRVVVAAALVRIGTPPETVSSLLSWTEYEQFCAGLLRASGYSVRTNIVITKPRRQLDIFADSPGLALSVDCKHWSKGFAYSVLERVATEQIERTVLYKQKRGIETPVLPAIFTMIDEPTRLVSGVPVVPVFALRDFLNSVSRFEPGFKLV